MDTHLVNNIRETLSNKTTADLLKIWETNDKENYSEGAFEAVRQLLADRSVDPPKQQIYRKVKKYEQFDNATASLFSLKTTRHKVLRKFHNWEIRVKPTALLFINYDNDDYIIVEEENFKNISINKSLNRKSGFIYVDYKGRSYVFEISKSDVSRLKNFVLSSKTVKRMKRRWKVAIPNALISVIFGGIGGLLIWLGVDKMNTSLLHGVMFFCGFIIAIVGIFGIQSAFNIVSEGRQLHGPFEQVRWLCPHCSHELNTWQNMPDPGEMAPCPYCSRPVTRNRW
jgi:hypothetical protein